MNYYEILGCTSTASFEELKASYYKLIKKHHPDKLLNSVTSDNSFINIDEAWKTLRDEELRKKYDTKLYQDRLSNDTVIYATICISELNFDNTGNALYPCRCGENFLISNKDIIDCDEFIIECSECSNSIQISK